MDTRMRTYIIIVEETIYTKHQDDIQSLLTTSPPWEHVHGFLVMNSCTGQELGELVGLDDGSTFLQLVNE